jgi:predicted nucleic acid-binding protein
VTCLLDTNEVSEVLRRSPNTDVADKADIVPVTVAAAHWSGEKRAMLASAGRTVTQADALIAACAWELGLVLATRNVEDFRGFGVPLLDPFAQAGAPPA